jgi:hypothetical protein
VADSSDASTLPEPETVPSSETVEVPLAQEAAPAEDAPETAPAEESPEAPPPEEALAEDAAPVADSEAVTEDEGE